MARRTNPHLPFAWLVIIVILIGITLGLLFYDQIVTYVYRR